MKKILLGFIVLFTFLLIPNIKVAALTDSFYEGEYISGEYIKKFPNGSGTGKYEQMRFFRRKSDNQVVYCIELWKTLATNKNIDGYDTEQYDYANLDYSTWEKIMLISYYGYGYKNHTDDKWYAITQFMIWKVTSPDSNIFFTDKLNGNKIIKYEQEINEINELVMNHPTLPSFNNANYEIRNNELITITDTNNVLDKFDIMSSSDLTVTQQENTYTLSKKYTGTSQIFLANKDKLYNTSPIVYVDSESQNLLAPGKYYPIYSILNITMKEANIIVTKLDEDTKQNHPQGDAKLSGSTFELLDNNNKVIDKQIIKNDGTLTFFKVGYGTYTIREVKAGEGYKLNNNEITIEVDQEVENITFTNEVVKNTIRFQKYIKNPITNETKIEANAKFSIYNNSNTKVITFETDENGKYQLELPYGTYTVKQESGIKNHLYIKDFKIIVSEDNKIQTYNLYNEELTSYIRIINTDNTSNYPLLESGAKFIILNKETNEEISLTTDDFGNTPLYLLSSGIYEIKQITSITNYEINNEIFTFEITDNTEYSYDENNNRYIEIIIPNTKKTSKVEIKKITEYYLDDQIITRKKDTETIIPIYASNDIYGKDKIKIYNKDEMVKEVSMLKSIELYMGNYYFINPINNEVINFELLINENKYFNIIDQVFEYTKKIEEKEEINIIKPSNPTEIINKVVENNQENIQIVNKVEQIKTKIIDDNKISVENSKNETVENSNNEPIITDLNYQTIEVPNTYITKKLSINTGSLLMMLGFILIIRKKYEN